METGVVSTANLNLSSEVVYEAFEDRGNSSENSGDSPPSTTVSVSSPKRSRRAIQKRVVKVPIKDIEAAGGRFSKGDCTTPPSDSWAWRKYGQKPIKGSPYPRGYYRCSSSKGCPARKQVERNRLDPSMLLITYSYDHNHSFPVTTRNHHHHHTTAVVPSTTTPPKLLHTPDHKIKPTTDIIPHPHINYNNSNESMSMVDDDPNNFPHLSSGGIHHETTTTTGSLITTADEFTWEALSNINIPSSSTSMFLQTSSAGTTMNNYPMMMREDEDSDLFADLGELPECSVVFGRKAAGAEDEEMMRRRHCSLSTPPWCGTTSTGLEIQQGLFSLSPGTALPDPARP